jgi:hypothetical protein
LEGVIADYTSSVTNVTTSETDLYSLTIPANFITTTGEKLTASYSGEMVSGNAKEIRVYFAGTQLFSSGSIVAGSNADDDWLVNVLVIRTGASTARAVVTGPFASGIEPNQQVDITGITWSNSNILKITGTGVANADITAKLGTVEFKPAANF